MSPPGRQSGPGMNRAAIVGSAGRQIDTVTITPSYDDPVDVAERAVSYAAARLEVLELCPDAVLERIAFIGTDDAVGQAYWLLEQRRATA
jgi:hypothetical protein